MARDKTQNDGMAEWRNSYSAEQKKFEKSVQTRTQSLCSLYYDFDGAYKGTG